MPAALQRTWLRRGPLARLLWPVSVLFGMLAALRRGLYRAGVLKAWHPGVPVVVVGNVVAGGAGKTPVVIALVEHLQELGIRCAVVSRGYGRSTTDCREVTGSANPHDVGDEPLLVATRCRVPVFVAPRRADAARALLAAHPATQVLLCDDGLQHYALARDIEICVFDERGAGNGWLLPAGPLREPWPRAADLVLRTGPPNGVEGYGLTRRLARYAVRADGTRMALEALRGTPFIALAGIARPEAFFAMLRDVGLAPGSTVALPDHHDFDTYAGPTDGSTNLVCTEKDAVKLWRRHPGAWAVPLVVDIAPAFWLAFDRMLGAKLSSPS